MKLDKLKNKGSAILITVLFIAIIVLINIFAGMLTDRFFLKADLTDSGVYTLSERAAEFLSEVNEPVDIIVLSEESAWHANNTFSMIGNILKNYSAASGGFLRTQYVNPDLNSFNGPKYNNSLTELKEAYSELEDMSQHDIIFLSSRRATLVSVIDLFSSAGLKADQELISALIFVLNEQIARIAFVNNHQESPREFMELYFERSGYVSSTINLALENIPDDTVVLVSAAPKLDFLSEEIIKLEQFLSTGGNVIILYDAGLPDLPLLENFMAEWGIAVERKLVFDEELTFIPQLGAIGAHVVAGNLLSTEIAETITKNEVPLGVFLTFPLRSEAVRAGTEAVPLIQTFSASSYAKDISSGGLRTTMREPGDESGPFVLAYNVSRVTRDADNNQVFANLIVAGDTLFDDMFLEAYGNSFYNIFLITNLASDLNPFGDRVFIPAKDISAEQMLVSSAGSRYILIIMVVLIPLTIIAAGAFVWRKRRHQ